MRGTLTSADFGGEQCASNVTYNALQNPGALPQRRVECWRMVRQKAVKVQFHATYGSAHAVLRAGQLQETLNLMTQCILVLLRPRRSNEAGFFRAAMAPCVTMLGG